MTKLKKLVLFALVLGLTLLWILRGLSKKSKPISRTMAPLAVRDITTPHPSGTSFQADSFDWTDSQLRPRSVVLIKNTAVDPTGNNGGYIRSYRYESENGPRTCTGSSDDNPGFGYLVNHYNDAENNNHWLTSLNTAGTTTRIFVGPHHAIHEFRWTLDILGQPVDAIVHWFFANGQDHPVFAVTYDLSRGSADVISADSRSPYGDLGWDGDKRSHVSGIGWGDRFKFKSTSRVLSMQSAWDYTEENLVPYVHMWSEEADAEMGLVQTQTWQQHDAGGYWFYSSWGKRSDGPMPENWNWTYQLNQYQLAEDPTSKRLAWGMNYGSVGQSQYNSYGDDRKLSGYPYQSYSVLVALGEHKAQAVAQAVSRIERVQSTFIKGTNIRANLEGPAGAGRSDRTQYTPFGWNPVYGVWELSQIADGQPRFDFIVERGRLQNPIFRVKLRDNTEVLSLALNNSPLVADQDYLLSWNEMTREAWITLLGEFEGTSHIDITISAK